MSQLQARTPSKLHRNRRRVHVRMKILIADSFPETHQQKLIDAGHQITVDASLQDDALKDALTDHEILIVRSTAVTEAMLKAGDNLRLVIRAGAGTNTIDKETAAGCNIRVCNVPGANAIAVAELVIGMMISLDRFIPDNVNDLNNGIWNKKKYSAGRGLHGQSVGILGLGAIGFAVAERARAFGMRVFALKKASRSAAAEQQIASAQIEQLESLDELLKRADIVTLHLPATNQTTGMVNDEFLGKMRNGAMLINTSRGELVDDAALLRAIDNKSLRVALDVYNNEPGASDNRFDSEIANHPAVCSTHHIGASTTQAQVAVSDGVLEVIAAFQQGELKNCVN